MNDDAREFTSALWGCCYEAVYYQEREPILTEPAKEGAHG